MYCYICQDILNEDIHTTECNHNFHLECISLIRKLECPACRSPISLPEHIIKIIKQKEKDDEEIRILTQELRLIWSQIAPFLNEMETVFLPTGI